MRARGGGLGSREAVNLVEMWLVRERAAQRRAAQRAGVGDVGASATAWGRGVQARLRGSW